MKSFWEKVTVQGVIVGLVAGMLLGGIAAAIGRF